jgi:hypothetical protein
MLLLSGELRYVSWSSRPVFGRWSYSAASAIGLTGLALLASLARSVFLWHRWRSDEARAGERAGTSELLREIGYLLTGAAYLLAALDDSQAGGRILELDLLGSLFPPAIALEGIAIAAFISSGLFFAWQRWRRRAPGPLSVALALGVVFVVGEAGARISATAFPASQGFPTASTQLWFRRHVALNSEGFRDRERTRAKPAGVRRIAVVGDSFAFGQGIDRPEERVSDRLEGLLSSRLGTPVDVLNAGVPFTHTLQHIDSLERVLAYSPDLVLLLYVFNDIDYLQSADRPTAVFGEPGSWSGRLHPLRVAFKNSFLAQQVYIHARHVYWKAMPRSALPPDPYESRENLQKHSADLARFVALARAAGADVRLAPFDPMSALRDAADARRRFIESLVAADLPVWPLSGVFEGVPYSDLITSDMDHHPNERANELVAAALADLIERLWADAAPPLTSG